MSLSHIPLPSIALVLASDRPSLPSRPSVIKVEFDPLQTIHPTSPGPGRVLGPIGVQIDSAAVQTEGHNNVPVDERFFYCVTNDFSTDVSHSKHGQLDNGSAMLAETRPTTSRGSRSKGDVVSKGKFMVLAATIHNVLLQFKLKRFPINRNVQVTMPVVNE